MKIPFLFGIHCHQPAENFYNVVDWAINESYAPFIEVALKNKTTSLQVFDQNNYQYNL